MQTSSAATKWSLWGTGLDKRSHSNTVRYLDEPENLVIQFLWRSTGMQLFWNLLWSNWSTLRISICTPCLHQPACKMQTPISKIKLCFFFLLLKGCILLFYNNTMWGPHNWEKLVVDDSSEKLVSNALIIADGFLVVQCAHSIFLPRCAHECLNPYEYARQTLIP